MNPYDFGFDFPKDDAIVEEGEEDSFNNKLGTLLTEQYMTEFIDKEIFFVGEFVNYKDDILTIKSFNGTFFNCITHNAIIPDSPKYVGIKGTVTKDLKIKETRGLIFLNINDPYIFKEYTDIYMKHRHMEVFASSY